MTTIKLIIKGFFIGMGKIIPGVSGAVLAIILNLYDDGLKAITSFFDDVKGNSYFLLRIGIGIIISILCFSNIIIYLLSNYYFLTMMFFIGLIMGGIKEISRKIDHNRTNYLYICFSFTFLFILTIIMNSRIKLNSNFFLFFISGILDAISTIIPGISGTSLLMLLGTYNGVVNSIGNIWNIEILYQNIKVILPFSLGLFLGIIVFAKIMNNMFQKYYQKTISFVLGLSLATSISLLFDTLNRGDNLINLVLGIILFIIGVVLSNKLND